jgi:hypothetical protein
MRVRVALLVVVTLAMGLLGAPGAQAAPKKENFTILLAASEVGSATGAGHVQGASTAALRRACPGPGELDGAIYKFIDLKGMYSKLKAYGPTPLFTQTNAAGTFMDYDIDLFAYDAKCVRVETKNGATTGANGGGIEVLPTKKPVRYAVIVYWQGAPNIPVTLEYS